jgi:type IV pilus assembly protein PilC
MTDVFAYEARSRAGAFVAGTVAAASRVEALDALAARSLSVTALARAESARGALSSLRGFNRSSAATRAAIFRCLATLVGAGVGIRRSLEIVGEQCRDARFRSALSGVCAEIERGVRLSDALRRHPREFSEIVSALVFAGELSGALDGTLGRIADLLERGVALRRQIAGALIYPATVAAIACALVGFLVVAVIPEMASMLRGFGAPLPPATAFLFAIATAMREPDWLLGCGSAAALAAGAAWSFARTTRGSAAWDRVRFGFPVLGTMSRKASVAACSRTLGTTLQCGVPMPVALSAAASMTSSRRLRAVFDAVGEAVALGQHVAPAFAASELFDPLVVGLIRAGEESGTLDAMLLRGAEHLEAEVRSATASLAAVIEPLLIVFLGGAIAAIVAAVLMPLYSTIGSIS